MYRTVVQMTPMDPATQSAVVKPAATRRHRQVQVVSQLQVLLQLQLLSHRQVLLQHHLLLVLQRQLLQLQVLPQLVQRHLPAQLQLLL